MAFRQRALPKADNFREDFIRRYADEKMKMVGHQDSNFAVPIPLFVINLDGFENGWPDVRTTKMVLPAWVGADREEIIGNGVDPIRHFVVEAFSRSHDLKMPLR